jgi:5-methylthioadenosine/S-adenosylhomocysteine deaminase
VLRIRARRIHPVTAPPFEDGAVLVGADGRIAAIGREIDVPAAAGCRTLEFPNAELLPGLVNCHTHLELTHLAGRHAEPDFTAWIRGVRALKDATTAEEFMASAEAGLRDCWKRGVTCVADTGSSGAALDALLRLGGRGIVYHEVFGPDPKSAEECFSEFEQQVRRLLHRLSCNAVPGNAAPLLGVSPHAPYTVSAPLYRLVADLARRERLPLALHVAESPAETELIRDAAGPFADALRARGIEVRPSGMSPLSYLVQLGVITSANCLCIHCVQVDTDDIVAIARAGAAVAHCPRSNLAHGHGRAPLASFLERGVRVGLGTDSVVSVRDLDLAAEARAAGFDGPDALRALTLDGARALGLEADAGSLEVGKWGDLAVVSSVALSSVLLTVVGGRVVHPIDFDA